MKILSQSNPSSGVLTDIYTAPSLGAYVDSIIVCNGGSDGIYSISIAIAGASDNIKQYITKDNTISANKVTIFSVNLDISSGSIIRVKGNNASFGFQVLGGAE